MTMPHLMNCEHIGYGWCLDCVKKLHTHTEGWQPIATAPKNGEQRIIIAQFRGGELVDMDFDAVLEKESESWEMPQTYWIWKSANGRVEEPTHWIPLPEPPDVRVVGREE